MNTTAKDVMANIALMEKRAADLTQLLNKLQWPEAQGPYAQRARAPHVVQGTNYTISVNYDTALFAERVTHDCYIPRHRFIDLPQGEDYDIPAWLATEFLGWITEKDKHEATK